MADTPTNTKTATHRTLNITELLENILLALPTRDLLLSQKVSKTFQATIAESPQLQQALFFAPRHLAPDPSRHLVYNDAVTNKILDTPPIEIRVDYTDHRSIHIQIDWATATIACDPQQTLSKMLLWDSNMDEDNLHVCINMRESYCHRGRSSKLKIKFGELGFAGVPTVSEFVKLVQLHPKTRSAATHTETLEIMAEPQIAAQRTLNITELLEQIVLELPPKCILVFQRVNKMFKATIDNSILIQQALWFKRSRTIDGATKEPDINPMLNYKSQCYLAIAFFSKGGRNGIDVVVPDLQRLQESGSGTSFANMLLWDQCSRDTRLEVTIYDRSTPVWERWLAINVGELALEKPPTVAELLKLVLDHAVTRHLTEDDLYDPNYLK